MQMHLFPWVPGVFGTDVHSPAFLSQIPKKNSKASPTPLTCNCFRRTRRQDIRNGDPLTHCSDLQHHGESGVCPQTCRSATLTLVHTSSRPHYAHVSWRTLAERPLNQRKSSGRKILKHTKHRKVFHCHRYDEFKILDPPEIYSSAFSQSQKETRFKYKFYK